MKKTVIISGMLVSAVLFAGCVREELPAEQPSEVRTAVFTTDLGFDSEGGVNGKGLISDLGGN